MDKIKNLLQQVSIIQKKYDEIAKITGENFNIFSIMRVEYDEVRTHSRIIAEFLNPKGKHSQGSVFLELFFEEIESLNNLKEDFDFKNAQVIIEEHIGVINKEFSEGGYIDIVIKDSKSQIVIENKIYAGDQKAQLLRYKNNYPNCKLIYLTLEGKEPCQSSYKIENGQELTLEEIILVSYKNEIKNWIGKCLEKTHSLPIIRESLVQYLHLIKKLTNQTTNKKMSNEILNIITNDPSNFDAFIELDNVKTALRKYILEEKIFKNIEEIGKELNLESDLNKNKDSFLNAKPYAGFHFTNDELKKMNINITVQFKGVLTELRYGLTKIDLETIEDETTKKKKEIFIKKFTNNVLGNLIISGKNEWWYADKNYESYYNWNDLNTLKNLHFDDFKSDLKGKIEQIIKILL